MTVKQCLSAAVATALMSGLWPAQARADEPAPAGSTSLRASIDRAVVRASSDRTAPVTLPSHGKARVAKQASNGGGGGHTALILGLVGTAAGLGATYYLVKGSQKQTSDLIGQVQAH